MSIIQELESLQSRYSAVSEILAEVISVASRLDDSFSVSEMADEVHKLVHFCNEIERVLVVILNQVDALQKLLGSTSSPISLQQLRSQEEVVNYDAVVNDFLSKSIELSKKGFAGLVMFSGLLTGFLNKSEEILFNGLDIFQDIVALNEYSGLSLIRGSIFEDISNASESGNIVIDTFHESIEQIADFEEERRKKARESMKYLEIVNDLSKGSNSSPRPQ
jgi:hypothetical protein